MYELVFSETANNDIASSIKYIAKVLNAPMAAKKLFQELKGKYK
jgi:ABC-type Fe3+-hydroxamate transport system substrate-binding protein